MEACWIERRAEVELAEWEDMILSLTADMGWSCVLR